MNIKLLKSLIIFFSIAIGCGNTINEVNNNGIPNGLGSLSLSPDDSIMVFSYVNNSVASLYLSSADGSNPTLLSKDLGRTSYLNPTFSTDGKKVAFLSFPNNNIFSNIFIIDLEGKKQTQVTFGDHIITEAIFSSDNKKIIYCQANEFKHYSPIGVNAPHKYDVYEVNLNDGVTKKVTNLSAYGIYNISLIKKRYILMRLEGNEGGIYIFPIEHPDSLKEFIPENILKPQDLPFAITYRPAYSEKYNKIAFYYQSGIQIMDSNNRIANPVYKSISGGQINLIRFYNTQDRLIFTEGSTNIARSINSDGTGLITMDIRPPK